MCNESFYFLQLKVCMLIDKNLPELGVILQFPVSSSSITRETGSLILLMCRLCCRPPSPTQPWSSLTFSLGFVLTCFHRLFSYLHSSPLPPWLSICCSPGLSALSPPINTLLCPCTLPRIQMRTWTPLPSHQPAAHSPGTLTVSPHLWIS